MPWAPARPCPASGCPKMLEPGQRRCPDHQSLEWRRQDANRPNSGERGYDAAWRRKRRRFLAENPACATCGATATDVDHVVPRSVGGSDDEENLQGLCKACHSRKTLTQDMPLRRRARGGQIL